MKEFHAQPGDILVYSDAKNDIDRLIQFGEECIRHNKERGQPIAFHVAVALGAFHKIEAIASGVTIDLIDYRQCSVFRPPYNRTKMERALIWAARQKGKLYGWVGDMDQALRDLTFNRVHLPRAFIQWADKKWPYCSYFDAGFMVRAGYNDMVSKEYQIPKWPPPDPEAIFLLVRRWPVK
ncbi:hypothetical protein [Alicyclobacillus sp. SO9]|uniref:hypothetical protein n=1 Tax=Alicyclobacillus sp. SO9 TaxID=2665646 RepID=UPI0018E8D0D9|nr:hypothetical protein [Alicyclobacillus sp. SO9]QQE80942.1 hypothetical protein GI364_11455 [Alicyclobacillus sp. SO9]